MDPRQPTPDDPSDLLPDAPNELPDAPVKPIPDDGNARRRRLQPQPNLKCCALDLVLHAAQVISSR